jgi:hypothetical protein
MRPDGGGGGGATILIDPDSLRRAGSRLKGVAGELERLQSALSSLDVPLLPPSVAGTVPEAISAGSAATYAYAPSLNQVVVELTRRAFWAEYADQLTCPYTLSADALKQFEQYMADGTLLQYATADEARNAGIALAIMGENFRKDPSVLFMLAASLKGGESEIDPTIRHQFEASFVNTFGATRMNEIPRAIQAIESSQQLTFNSSITDPFVLRDMAQLAQQQGIEMHGDPLKLLAPFSVALADATSAGLVTRVVEQQIASSKDAWSTAALLSQGGHFGTPFLLDCFKSGVVDKIAQESPYNVIGNPGGPPLPVEYTLGWSDGHPLPNDTKQIILEALSRNPEAASQALTQPIDVRAANEYGQWSDVHDPVQLLYQYGHFDDNGTAFGNAYSEATKYLNGDLSTNHALPFPHSDYTASQLTQNALVQMLSDDHDGMSGFKNGLATDLSLHHMGDLYDSALRNLTNTGPEGVQLQGLEKVANAQVPPGQLELSRDALIKVIDHLSGEDTAFKTFVHGSAAYQGALIDANTQVLPDPGSSPEWATKIGAFDSALLNGADIHSVEDFDAASERHQLVADFFKEAANGVVTIEDPVAEAAVHTGIGSVIDSVFPGPDAHEVVWKSFDQHQSMQNSLQAAITAGYEKHGLIPTAPPGDIVVNGHVVSFDSLPTGGDAQTQYAAWMHHDSVTKVAGTAFQTAQNTISAHVAGFQP